jgi:hypothetical protein
LIGPNQVAIAGAFAASRASLLAPAPAWISCLPAASTILYYVGENGKRELEEDEEKEEGLFKARFEKSFSLLKVH